MTFINDVNKDFEKLKSVGFTWDEDIVKGMVFQLCAPTTGEYGMDIINATLDAQYQLDKKPFSSTEVRAAMQNLITTRRTVHESEGIQALSSSFAQMNTGNLNNRFDNQPRFTPPRYSTPSKPILMNFTGPTPPGPISALIKDRNKSEINPIKPGQAAAPKVLQGLFQCFHGGVFGHGTQRCPLWMKRINRTAPHFWDWRKTNLNRFYSIQALGLNPSSISAR
ncbi:uncharacterized protein MELLADRAFT_55725 [Melampsora larici-populina 98AG31]|uniref:Uncharacterized protein n=1 Tax=Melampsora larici-populina (strain 98AG31 / pathotype 3-4-7) TaxID=747676 RepID=F4RHT6_MELLP|nr:uncharacterized protein MELLADRAFT_55725 [Melampsora larici-populina 98AG31]EGG07884.1 hypothetical protein MELLADRAFT_55725 [Melampsora larici-populina 98AG31]